MTSVFQFWESVVMQVKREKFAVEKVTAKRPQVALPVHSFSTLCCIFYETLCDPDSEKPMGILLPFKGANPVASDASRELVEQKVGIPWHS